MSARDRDEEYYMSPIICKCGAYIGNDEALIQKGLCEKCDAQERYYEIQREHYEHKHLRRNYA